MKNRIAIKDLSAQLDQVVTVAGWVDVRRDHGKLIFLDLRDRSGKVQAVVLPDNQELLAIADQLRPEWVISATGLVNRRPDKMVKADELNGQLELSLQSIEILNRSDVPPFDLAGDGRDIGEEHRLRYRYLDLRRRRLLENLTFRHQLIKLVRDELSTQGFLEIETPILTKSTPEGARDYVVPARLYQGKFYALPQSPQQYKQLLMTAGIEKYFQFAKCFRDEDTRGDRQPEFTQMDLECSFVDREEVMALNEELMIKLITTLAPEKTIQTRPFPRLTYAEAMSRYGTDRPDLRENKDDPNLLAFCWVVDFPFFEKTDEGGWTFTHNPFSRPKDEHRDWLLARKHIGEILTTQYDLALNGFEIGGGSLRSYQAEMLRAVFEIMGFTSERIEKNFGHMLEAYAYGTPPHGGIAWGLDRLLALLRGEPNIREVMAFPKTGEGRDLMMAAPSEIEAGQLTELGLKITPAEK